MPHWDKRQENREWTTNFLIENDIPFESHNKGAHLVIGDYDFWPGTGLFIHRPSQEKGRGIRNLMKLLRTKV